MIYILNEKIDLIRISTHFAMYKRSEKNNPKKKKKIEAFKNIHFAC